MTVGEVQATVRRQFGHKDAARGPDATFLWLAEEVGELAAAIRQRATDRANLEEEFADVLAWLATLANLTDVDLTAAFAAKYGRGCPGCAAEPCVCDPAVKP